MIDFRSKSRSAAILTAIALILASSTSGAAVRIKVSRNTALHQTGNAVFSMQMTDFWGGVVLQAEATFVDSDGSKIDSSTIGLGKFDSERGALCVSFKGKCFYYKIDEDSLARIASWVENGGTGLYTYWNFVSESAARSAGLSKSRFPGYVSAEFFDSPLESLSHYLDFPNSYLLEDAPDATALIERRNAGLAELDGSERDETYVVSDLDSGFTVVLRSESAESTGTVYLYARAVQEGAERAHVTYMQRFATGSLKEVASRIGASGDDDVVDAQDVAKTHLAAIRLAQTAALLRTIHDKNAASWNDFSKAFFTETREVR